MQGTSLGQVDGDKGAAPGPFASLNSAMERMRQFARAHLERVLVPVARVLMRLGVTPNQVSISGVVLNVVAAGLVVSGHLVYAGVLYLVAGILDLLDGVLARVADAASPFGAFVDSTLDRISEGVIFAALAYHFAVQGQPVNAAFVVVALLGSLLVSYVRARAEGLGAECKVGIVTRAERVGLLAIGLVSGYLVEAIYVLVGLTAVTVVQRIVHTARQLADKR